MSKPVTPYTPIGIGAANVRKPRPGASTSVPGVRTTNSNTRVTTATLQRPLVTQSTQAGQVNLGLNSERLRGAMVQRLRDQGIVDERVLTAMQAVPRHTFVDEALASRAYEDAALPIGHGQTISQPWIVARMLSAAFEGRTPTRVLEVGAGCGYQASVMAQFVREVHAIERIRGLYDLARENLRNLRPTTRVRLVYGDGMIGLPNAAPFDAIIIAAAGLQIPQALLTQLAPHGRLIAPEGGAQQRLVLIERTSSQNWSRVELEAVRFVPLRAGIQS